MIALALTILLTACGTGPSNQLVVTPTLHQYGCQFLRRAGDELASLPGDAALRTIMRDFAEVRQQIRAAKGVENKCHDDAGPAAGR